MTTSSPLSTTPPTATEGLLAYPDDQKAAVTRALPRAHRTPRADETPGEHRMKTVSCTEGTGPDRSAGGLLADLREEGTR